MKKIIYFLNFLLVFALPINAKTLEQKLNVEIGVFDAAKVIMSYSIDDKKYAFSSNVETAGMFAKLYYFSATYATNGNILNNKFITKDYSYVSKSKSSVRTKKLVFDDVGTLLERISSKNKKEKKVKIDITNQVFDFNDLQSVFAYLVKQLSNNKICDMEKEVFDGKKKYKITIKNEGNTNINDEDVEYKGEAQKCNLFIKRTDYDDDDLLFSTTAERPINFWIAREKESLMPFVVKIEIDSTPLGKLKAYTTDIIVKE